MLESPGNQRPALFLVLAAPARSQRGIALLLVLWIIMFLAVICAEFSWTMRTESATAVGHPRYLHLTDCRHQTP